MNKTPIAETELIINQRGAIYHLDLQPEQIADTVITVGSPDRVKEVSKYFDRVTDREQHREFITHTGYIGSKQISVVSTGIGVGNIDIVCNELDALVNIDFETRTLRSEHKKLKIIRLGTCGSLHADIPADSLIASSFAAGMDNLLLYYQLPQDDTERELQHAFQQQILSEHPHITPYVVASPGHLLQHFTNGYVHGITATCPGFYGPQGRSLRLTPALPNLPDALSAFRHNGYRIANFEMETSALYGMSALLGHQCLSISTAVANRATKTFTKNGDASVENMIKKSLEIIERL